MKPLLVTILAFSLFINGTEAYGDGFEFEYKAGYRIDNLVWTIAGDMSGNNPNILSELTFSDLKIIQGEILITKSLTDKLYLIGDLELGMIINGKNQDSDYLGDNRTHEFSRSYNDCNGNAIFDISTALGYYLIPKSEDTKGFGLSGLIGYGINCQNLLLTNGYQAIWIDPETGTPGETGPISGLNTTYKAYWKGFWIGLNVEKEIKSKIKFILGYEYHQVDYTGEGNWNLRNDFEHPKSFEHITEGTGKVINTGLNWIIKDKYKIAIIYSLGEWETDGGIDKTYFSDGSRISTKFNGANWDTKSIMISVKYLF